MNQYTELSGNAKKDSLKPGFQGTSYAKLAKGAVLGTIIGVFSSVILMIVFAVIINAVFGDPDSVLNIFTCIAASSGALIGGYNASRINGSKGFICGIMTGVTISLVILVIMMFGGKGSVENAENHAMILKLVIILCQIIFACIGGVFAVNSGKAKRTVRTYPINKKK